MNETKEQRIVRLESIGHIVRDCPGCVAWYELSVNVVPFAPRHKPSARCESGKRAHCTCDACF